ncbi:hypothetical protein KY332_03040 [Candidatus Woesearchaeota archaeon]|nr:hypothetical protein [Candidatus Woesearchaeota archaeon]
MALRMGKKAVFFTFIATVFLGLLIFSYTIGANYRLRQISFSKETRINTMDMFVTDIEDDVERGAYIAGFRSLVALVDNVVSTGVYLSDVDSDFNELFFNGTFNETNSSFLENNTFTDWMDKIKVEAEKIDILINFTIHDVSLFQDEPWTVGVDVNLTIVISDEEGVSRWNRRKSIKSYIELEDFEDPFYPLGTNGVVENRIRRTIHDDFVIGSNIDNLLNHTYEGYYIEFTGAPSYLMRLEGDFGSSEYGIESLVDIDELVTKGVGVEDKTIVDYIYFNDSNDPSKSHVSGAPSWFDLDNSSNMDNSLGHFDLYEVTGLV